MRVLTETEAEEQGEWEAAGNAAIARGQVAVVLLATSLVPGAVAAAARAVEPVPGLPSGKCCLQLYAERVLRAQQLAARAAHGANAPVAHAVPFYIMTSPDTHDQVGLGAGSDQGLTRLLSGFDQGRGPLT
jgi:UDP-N-acetylglucosamine pyrophosphorylase